MDKNEDFNKVLEDKLKMEFEWHFNHGLMAGWDACIYEISKQIVHMTSAKAIKELIKSKVGEADKRKNRGDDNATN